MGACSTAVLMPLLRFILSLRYQRYNAWQAEEEKTEGTTMSNVETWNGTNRLQTQASPCPYLCAISFLLSVHCLPLHR